MRDRDSQTAKPARPGTGARRRPPPTEYRTLSLRCPVCRTEFNAEVPSAGEFEGRETDLRPIFAFHDPLPWQIHACPSCRYSAYRAGFDGAQPEPDDADEPFRRKLGDRDAPRSYLPDEQALDDLRRWIRRGELQHGLGDGGEPFGAERYLLGARCFEFLWDDALGVADYYLRASWCARAAEDRECERECQRQAAHRMYAALEAEQVPEPDRTRALYLVGELSRRSGAFARAVDAFSQLESMGDQDDEEGALFTHLAKRQLALAVVMSDINAVIAQDETGLEG